MEILFLKIDDSFRRRRTSRPFGTEQPRESVDRLLDYCQALESILPFKGDQVPAYAADLLHANRRDLAAKAADTGLLRDMYKLRNMVMHGSYALVLKNQAGTRHTLKDVEHFRRRVHALAILYFLNPDQNGWPNLRRFIKESRKGKQITLNTL
jgi:hypothetical protein